MNFHRIKIIIISLLIIFSTESYKYEAKSPFILMYKKEMKKYNLVEKSHQSFLGVKNIKEISLERRKNLFVSFFEIPIKQVDSTFFREYKEYAYKQSCGTANRDSLVFYSFKHQDYIYIIKPCSACSDFFADDCYQFKRKFIRFLWNNHMEHLDSLEVFPN